MKSMSWWLMVGFSMAILTTAGCAGKHQMALDTEAAQRIKTVRLISIIPQAALVPTIRPSAGSAAATSVGVMFGAIGGAIGGAISAGIDAGQFQEATAKLAALVEPQKRMALREEFSNRMRAAAEGSNRFVIEEAETVIKGDGASERDRALNDMPQDAVLTVTTNYYLSPDFRVFHVVSHAELWQKRSKEQVYGGQWQYHSEPREGEDESRIIAAWAADDGEALVSVAHEAIDKIALMMKVDLLGEPVDPGELGTTTVSYTAQPRGEPINVEGKVLLRRAGWDVARSEDGSLHAVHASDTGLEGHANAVSGSSQDCGTGDYLSRGGDQTGGSC